MVDTSGSTLNKISTMQVLLIAVIGRLPANSPAFLAAFSSRTYLLQPLTTNHDLLANKLRLLHAYGQTSLYDALVDGAHIVSRGISTSRRLILITDGMDKSSGAKGSEIAEMLKRANIDLTVIGVGDPHKSGGYLSGPDKDSVDMNSLQQLASACGGRFLLVGINANEQTCQNVAREASTAVGVRYGIGFTAPQAVNTPWAPVRVKVDKPSVTVTTTPELIALTIPEPPLAGQTANISGYFSGQIANVNGVEPEIVGAKGDVVQNGDRLSGEWNTDDGYLAKISGTLTGDRISIRYVREAPCAGTFEGFGTVIDGGGTIRGSMTGRDCTPATHLLFELSKTRS